MDNEEYFSLICEKSLQDKLRNYIASKVYGHHNIEDLLQKTNLTLVEKQDQYKDSGKIKSFAFMIAFWKIKEWKKKEARAKVTFDQEVFDNRCSVLKNEVRFSKFQDYELLNTKLDFIIENSSSKASHIIKLYLLGMKPREIQEETGYKISVIYKTHQRVKERLKAMMKDHSQ